MARRGAAFGLSVRMFLWLPCQPVRDYDFSEFLVVDGDGKELRIRLRNTLPSHVINTIAIVDGQLHLRGIIAQFNDDKDQPHVVEFEDGQRGVFYPVRLTQVEVELNGVSRFPADSQPIPSPSSPPPPPPPLFHSGNRRDYPFLHAAILRRLRPR